MTRARVPSVDEIWNVSLEVVALVEQDERVLRFRVSDPMIYPAFAPFDLLFDDAVSFAGDDEMDDVMLRTSSDHTDIPEGYSLYEFVSRSVVPTEGRPYQLEILSDGQHRVSFGDYVDLVRGRVVARTLSIVAVRSD